MAVFLYTDILLIYIYLKDAIEKQSYQYSVIAWILKL